MNDPRKKNSEHIINMAKEFISFMQGIEPKWERAFWRFNSEESNYGCRVSYISSEGVKLIDAIKESQFMQTMNSMGRQLWEEWENPDKRFCVCLLCIDHNFEYEIKFEYYNINKWQITKIDGGSGIPEDL